MRLWARLALIMSAVAMASVAVVGFWAMNIAGSQAEGASKEQLRREALLHAEVIGRWITDQNAQAEAWTQVFPSQLASMNDTLRTGFLSAVYRGTPSAVVVVLVDGDGRLVVPAVFAAIEGDRQAADRQRADELVRRLPLTEALGSGSGIGAPFLPDGSGALPSVPIAVLAASADNPEDALVLGIEVRMLAAAELQAQSEPTHGIALIGDDGDVLVGAGHPLLRPQLLRKLLRKDADFRYGEGAEEVLGSIVPVPYTRWSTVVFEPAAAVRASSHQIRRSLVASAVVAALAATLLALAIAGRVSQPITRLRDAALAIAQGSPQQANDVTRTDEIGELARAFNHMSTQLLTQRQAIEGFNHELQERVDARTADLRDAQAELVRSGQLTAVAEVGAGLAHELNNPLASVLGLAQILKARNPDDGLVADLEAEAARCREVVGAMLKFTSGEVDPQNSPVIDLRRVVTDVTGLVAGAFKQRGVVLTLTISEQPLPVRLDPVAASRMLAQVLNALRSGLEPGATLAVSAALAAGDHVEIGFRADQVLAHSKARQDDWRASGLELWAARQVVDRSGGRLEDVSVVSGPTHWSLLLPSAETT